MLDFRKYLQRKGTGREAAVTEQTPSRPREAPASPDLPAGAGQAQAQVKRKILVVAKAPAFSPGVLKYAASLAERLDYDLIALSVHPALEGEGSLLSPFGRHQREKFARQARAAWTALAPEVAARGVTMQHLVKFGQVARAVSHLNQEIRRLDFVITDVGFKDEELAGGIPLPFFSITGYQGEKVMAQASASKGLGVWGKTAVYGAMTAVLYAAVFWNGGTVMSYFTRGGWYAALPIATVFVFSLVHGTFAHHLWSALGIEAPRKAEQPRPEVTKRPVRRPRPRPRLHLNA